MGLKTNHEGIRNVRSGKGVMDGCQVSRSAANTLSMTAGRVKFGLTSARIAALNDQQMNEGGVQQAVSATTFDASALTADRKYVLYIKTDGSLAVTPEAGAALTEGPMVLFNVPGVSPAPNVEVLHTPSVRLCSFKKTAGDVTDIDYDMRESLI